MPPGGGPARRAVDAADLWADEHLALLSASFETFASTEEWPSIEELRHRFEVESRFTDASDLGRLAWQMPSPLGFVEQGRMVLLCQALLHVPAAAGLLEDWYRSVRYAYDCWLDDPGSELISHEIVDLLGGDEKRARLVGRVLLREGWMFDSGTGGAGEYWTRKPKADVGVARDTHNARELLDARVAALDAATPEFAATEEEPPQEPTRPARLWRSVSNNPLLATFLGGLLVIAVVASLGLAYSGVKELVDSIGHDSAPTFHGNVERAGEGGARTFPVPGVLAKEGPAVKPGEKVRVACWVHAPQPPSAVPDGNWYKLSSRPWDGRYFAAANSFWNGDVPGELPYEHNTDYSVAKCG